MKNNEALVAEICRLHYIDNFSQNEISSDLRISKSTVSRLLKEGREKKIVSFHIKNYEDRIDYLEHELKKYFDLKEAVVVSDEGIIAEDFIKKKVAKAAALSLERRIRDGDTIAVSWGTTLSEIGKALDVLENLTNTEIVPLLGGIGITGRDIFSNEIARRLSKALDGKYYLLNAPVFVSNLKTKEAFEKEESIKVVIEKAKSAYIAIVGIGTPKQSSTMIKRGYCSVEEFSKLSDKGVVGDICTDFFDINGNILKTSLKDKMIGIGLKELRKYVPIVIGVACGNDKKEAVLGALRGKHINAIVTNKKVAEYVIENTK
jgi:deoxyribonucleoside regulator